MIAGSILMVGDAEEPFAGREAAGPTHVSPHIHLDDVDAAATQADRSGSDAPPSPTGHVLRRPVRHVAWPFGHVWVLLTHQEDLEPAEIMRRGEAHLGT
jgi:PhnB protein